MKIIGNDVKFIKLSDNDLISNVIERCGIFDAHVLKNGVELLKNVHTGTVLDIGANMGSFTIPMAKSKPNIKFMAFEPQKMIYYQLCGNVAINKLHNVEPFNLGLGNTFKTINIEMPDYDKETNIGAFSLDDEVRSQPDYLCKTKGKEQSIQIKKLDSFLIEEIKLIKIDVEGMELDVLMGGLATLKNNNYPPILFESWVGKPWFSARRKELFNWLTDLGYTVRDFGDDNVAIYGG
jgi:FkbM family methyltransferase